MPEHNIYVYINFLPNNKILDWSKLKGFADDKINVTEKLKLVLERVENIVVSPFPTMFSKRLLCSVAKHRYLGGKDLTLYSIDTHFNTSTTDCF